MVEQEVLPGVRSLENAVVRLLKERPFYGHFLIGFRREAAASGGPLAVTIRNGTPVLRCNPELFARYSPAEQQALLEHVIKHVLHLHPSRQKTYHRLTWDVATDLAINSGIANLPEDALRPERFRLDAGLAAEEYVSLLKSVFETGRLEGDGIGRATAEQQGQESTGARGEGESGNLTADDHSLWSEADSTPERLAEQVVRDMVSDAKTRAGGEVPADIRSLVDGWLRPPDIPWREVLRQFVATAGRVGRQSTWKREHRRFAHSTPGQRKRKRLNLLVGIDTSESTDILELREAFARELLAIAKSRDSLITVVYANSRIRRVENFTGNEAVVEVHRGGGFTDLRPVFDYARTMQPLPAAVIYLTDGYGQAPETMEFPTLWALTLDGNKPVDWGVELRLKT